LFNKTVQSFTIADNTREFLVIFGKGCQVEELSRKLHFQVRGCHAREILKVLVWVASFGWWAIMPKFEFDRQIQIRVWTRGRKRLKAIKNGAFHNRKKSSNSFAAQYRGTEKV
jgi:hypothetical protein